MCVCEIEWMLASKSQISLFGSFVRSVTLTWSPSLFVFIFLHFFHGFELSLITRYHQFCDFYLNLNAFSRDSLIGLFSHHVDKRAAQTEKNKSTKHIDMKEVKGNRTDTRHKLKEFYMAKERTGSGSSSITHNIFIVESILYVEVMSSSTKHHHHHLQQKQPKQQQKCYYTGLKLVT